MPALTWTAEQTAELERMWREGASAGVISSATGRSRNAVVGKADRMGLPHRASQSVLLSGPPRGGPRRYSPRPRVQACEVKPEPPVHSEPQQNTVAEPSSGVTLMELQHWHCRWILTEDVRKPPVFYCGQPVVEGSSYCREHIVRAHTRVTQKVSGWHTW